MIVDWTGDRFLYESPYGTVNLQLDAQTPPGQKPKKEEFKVEFPKV
jgi:hypothetical protein